jgi:imidazolonepropionase-like amidohydrolase
VSVRALAVLIFVSASPAARTLGAQSAVTLASGARDFVSVSDPVVVLSHVTVIDGTGAPARPDQTIVIRDGRIAEIGAASSVAAPAGAPVMDLTGKTVIPGIVGMHDHLFYQAAVGREAGLAFSGPRLYLGSGVTTIRTTGTVAPYADINT